MAPRGARGRRSRPALSPRAGRAAAADDDSTPPVPSRRRRQPPNERRAAVADLRCRQRPHPRGDRAGPAAAVSAGVDVPRPRPARVPTGRRLRECLRGGVRRPTLLDRPGERPREWSYTAHRCGWSSPALGEQSPLRDVHRQPGVQVRALGRRASSRSSPTPVASAGGADDRAAESSPLVSHGTSTSPTRTATSTRSPPATGRTAWSYDTGAPVKASPALATGASTSATTAADLRALTARTGPADLAKRRSRQLLLHRRRRRRPRLRRLARRPRLRVLGRQRRHLWSFGTGRLRLRVAGRLARHRPRRLVRPQLLRDHGRHRRAPLDVSRPGSDLRRRVGRRRPRLLLDASTHRTYALTAASGHLRAEWPRRRLLPRGRRQRPPLPRRPRPDLRAHARRPVGRCIADGHRFTAFGR